MENWIVYMLAENKPGVLERITTTLARRNINIENITAGDTEKPGVTRITITFTGNEQKAEQAIKQMSKLINIIKVSGLSKEKSVIRELCIVKIHAPNEKRQSLIIEQANIFKGKILDVSQKSMIIELVGSSERINSFIELVKPYGIKEISRTGITAMARGTDNSNNK